jgi:hypothetical protein
MYSAVREAVKVLEDQGLGEVELKTLALVLDGERSGTLRPGKPLDRLYKVLALWCALNGLPETSGRRPAPTPRKARPRPAGGRRLPGRPPGPTKRKRF